MTAWPARTSSVPVAMLHAQHSLQHDRKLVELGSLPRLLPAARDCAYARRSLPRSRNSPVRYTRRSASACFRRLQRASALRFVWARSFLLQSRSYQRPYAGFGLAVKFNGPRYTDIFAETFMTARDDQDPLAPQREAAFFYGLFLRGHDIEELRQDIDVPRSMVDKWMKAPISKPPSARTCSGSTTTANRCWRSSTAWFRTNRCAPECSKPVASSLPPLPCCMRLQETCALPGLYPACCSSFATSPVQPV